MFTAGHPSLRACSPPVTLDTWSVFVTVKILALLAALTAVAAACGAGTVDDATANGELSSESAESDGAATTADPSDADPTDSRDADAASGAEDDMVDVEDVEPGSADDQSLVEDSAGPVGMLLFADTIEGPEAPSSVRFEGRMLIVGNPDSDLPGSYEISIAGAYDVAANASDLTIDMGGVFAAFAEADGEQIPPEMAALLDEPMQVIVVDEMGWMKWPFLSLLAGSAEGGDLWIELGADEVSDTTESFGFTSAAGDPTEMLERLAAAEASLEDLGVETVNGVEARHWRALLDLEALAEQSSPEERAELEAQFGDVAAAEFPLDVWIGVADGYIYRYVLELSSDAVLAGDPESEVDSATVTFDFFGYNADQGISPPPAELITSGEELFSGGFFDGFGG
jgi:hypothetical protein